MPRRKSFAVFIYALESQLSPLPTNFLFIHIPHHSKIINQDKWPKRNLQQVDAEKSETKTQNKDTLSNNSAI